MVSDIHIGKWMFYITPSGFKGYGLIERPSVIQGLYRCNNIYASQVLEEIEIPSDEEIEGMAIFYDTFESDQEDKYSSYKIGANYILNKLK